MQIETKKLTEAIESARAEISLLHEYSIRLIADVVTGKLDVRETAAALPDGDFNDERSSAVEAWDDEPTVDDSIPDSDEEGAVA